MKREMAILAQLTGVDDKLKLAILEATDEQQGKMIASLKERRAPFQWDEGGVDPFAVAAEQKRDRAIAYIEQQRKEHVALVERRGASACARRSAAVASRCVRRVDRVWDAVGGRARRSAASAATRRGATPRTPT